MDPDLSAALFGRVAHPWRPGKAQSALCAIGALRRAAALLPGPEERQLLIGPAAVTGHRAILEPLEDEVGVLLHLVVAPKVEPVLHRRDVVVPEQWADVGGE